jgi:hypothetical protein
LDGEAASDSVINRKQVIARIFVPGRARDLCSLSIDQIIQRRAGILPSVQSLASVLHGRADQRPQFRVFQTTARTSPLRRSTAGKWKDADCEVVSDRPEAYAEPFGHRTK